MRILLFSSIYMEPVDNNESTPDVTQKTAASSESSTTGKLVGLAIGAVIIIAGAVALFALDGNPLAQFTGSQDGSARSGDVVARVNGEEVTRGELDARVLQTEQQLQAQGQGAQLEQEDAREQLEQQALEQLISQKLILQAAAEANITVSDEQVEQQFQQTVSQLGSGDALDQQLAQFGLTQETFRQSIRDQLTVQQYLAQTVDQSAITVSDEEIQATYDQISAQQDVPPLAEVRDQVEAQLRQQKQNTQINELVQNLRADADIEILL